MDSSTPSGMAEAEPTWIDPKVHFRDAVREIAETILLAIIIFAALRFLVQNFRIEGHSMEPNLHDGQFLIVDKVSYRLGEVARGDIIVFHAPPIPAKDFIKRVIGLPGDLVEIRSGLVLVDDKPLLEPYVPYPGSRSWGPRVVQAGELFVLGDNRPSSNDSRQWGMLPMGEVVGKALLCYWPPEEWGMVSHAPYP